MVRLALAAVAAIVALMIVGIAVWFLGQSLMLALEAVPLSPPVARLITGAVGLVLALLMVLTAKALVTPRRVPATAPPSVDGLAVQLGALLAEQIASKTRSHPYQTMGAALVAGLAVGAVPELRKLITDLIARR